MRRRPKEAKTVEGEPHTLPLFREPDRFDLMHRPGAQGEAPQDLVLAIYSSALVNGHALAGAVARSQSVRERWALRRLINVEADRKELAATLLAEVWGVSLAA